MLLTDVLFGSASEDNLDLKESFAVPGTIMSSLPKFGNLKQPTVQGWILHCKDFWENFRISGFLCYKFIVLLSDFTLSIRFVTSEMKE